ncbi:hypothetical protein [Luteibacter yeojuensis]|uniref:Uncharacterized protein n=1 Tax=Luteibacter yeojuensis TaxID=345309 RepID=A0A0F3KPY8_9GAMM|nr:hypothetical protein [Luteibacter yeojuensis]KJV33335.1 hypothetical protein VI08_11180 [Luteibacter yeojuensis]
MVSIFTGLAFMHGHIVDKELVLRLGAAEEKAGGGKGAQAPARATQPRLAPSPRQPLVPGAACAHGTCG